MTRVAAIAETVRASRGFAHKRDIDAVVAALGLGGRSDAVRVGDDCAAIPDGDGFLLLAIEGFIEDFVAHDPGFAGYCGVMVNVSDIAAMGGRPIAVVDALWSPNGDRAAPILAGLRAGAAAYGVPIVGGHSNTRGTQSSLAVAILGRAKKLLTSFDARPGDDLVAAIDLRGRFREPNPFWDASSGAPAERLRGDVALLPGLAEDGLALAAKDISMGGILGTLLMLLECSGVGGTISLAGIPRPETIAIERWLTAFPSFGYVLAVPPRNTEAVIARFSARGIDAGKIGVVDEGSMVWLAEGGDKTPLWNFAESALIGCALKAASA